MAYRLSLIFVFFCVMILDFIFGSLGAPYQINPSERFSGECLIGGTPYSLLMISGTPTVLTVQC